MERTGRSRMRRRMALAALVGLIVVGAWSAGHAQGTVAKFEIAFEASGQVTLTCSRGCEWGWPVGSGVPQRVTFRCDSEPCRGTVTERGRVTLGQPLQQPNR